jgi:endonuclease III
MVKDEKAMKNAGKHADELKSLLKKLLKEAKPAPLAKLEAVPAIVRAALSFDVTDARAEEATKVIEREFVDLNELRVATELELQAMIGPRYPQIDRRATMMVQLLNTIFEREGTLSLERLRTLKKAEARQALRDLPGMHPFVEAYLLLFCFEQAAFPIDDTMLTYFQRLGIMDEGTTLADAQKFIEGHLKADDLYELYAALRRTVYTMPDDTKKKKK